MISAATAFCIALVVVIAATPLVRRFALDIGVVDQPGKRRVHERPIPRLGGIALVLAFFAPLLVLFGLETEVARQFFSEPLRIVGLVAGAVVVCGLGVLDDVRGVRAWTKLAVQFAAASLAYLCGFRIEAVNVPWLGQLDMGVFALPITVLWIAAIINAINLIDGLDGLAGGVAFFACVSNFVVGAINHDRLVLLLSPTLGGALLGFLLYNFNPASIFMGDSGSMFLGYVLATTSIMGSSVKSSTTVAILVPLIALGLPIIDTLFAMVRRFLERRPIFAADRGHIHHQLLAMGINHRRAVLILYGLSIMFTTGAILLSMGRDWQVGAALLVLSVAVIGMVRSMGDLHLTLGRWRRRERVRSAAVERLRQAVPSALPRIVAAAEVEELASVLQEFARDAQLSGVELAGSNLEQLPSFDFAALAAPGESDAGRRAAPTDAITAAFAIPSAGAEATLRLSFVTDDTELTPDADILLQLVADALDARLHRADSGRFSVSKGRLRSV